MTSNKSMIAALRRMSKLIEQINENVKELNAWKKVLNRHIGQQKRQHGQDWNDHYEYNPEKGECKRIYPKN